MPEGQLAWRLFPCVLTGLSRFALCLTGYFASPFLDPNIYPSGKVWTALHFHSCHS